MFIVSTEKVSRTEAEFVRALIFSNEVPETMPKTEDLPGYDNSYSFTADSMLYIVTTGAVYLAGEDGTWYEQ